MKTRWFSEILGLLMGGLGLFWMVPGTARAAEKEPASSKVAEEARPAPPILDEPGVFRKPDSAGKERTWSVGLFRKFRRDVHDAPSYEAPSYEAPGSTVTLDLPRVVEMALRNNFNIRIIRLDPLVQQLGVEAAWAAFSPHLELGVAYVDSLVPQNAQELISTGGTQENIADGEPRLYVDRRWEPKAAIKGTLPLGTEYSLEIRGSDVTNTTNQTSDLSLFTPEYSAYAGVKLKQPLLKGFGFNSQLHEVRVARTNTQIAQSDFESQLAQNLLEVLDSYYEYLAAWEEWRLRDRAMQLTQTLRDKKDDQVERGLVAPVEVDQMELQLVENRQDAFTALSLMTSAKLNLLQLIVAEFDAEKPTLYEPVDSLDESIPVYSARTLVQEALRNRPDYRKACQLLERENLDLKYYKNQSLPSADLEASYGVNGLDGNWGDAFQRAYGRRQGEEWWVGISISIPLGPNPNAKKAAASQIKKQQALLNIEKVKTTINLEVYLAMEQFQVSCQRLRSATKMSRRAENIMQNLEDQLERGTGSMVDVATAYVTLVDTRAEEIRAVKDVRRSEARIWMATGTIADHAYVVVDRSR